MWPVTATIRQLKSDIQVRWASFVFAQTSFLFYWVLYLYNNFLLFPLHTTGLKNLRSERRQFQKGCFGYPKSQCPKQANRGRSLTIEPTANNYELEISSIQIQFWNIRVDDLSPRVAFGFFQNDIAAHETWSWGIVNFLHNETRRVR